MAKRAGVLYSVTEAERNRLVELAGLWLTQTEIGRLIGRHPSTVSRHGGSLDLSFGQPQRQTVRRSEQLELRRQRRHLEDELIRRFAEGGWSRGMAANELDLDQSTLWRHSRILGVNWLVRGQSRRGDFVQGLAELRRLRIQIQARGRSSGGQKPGRPDGRLESATGFAANWGTHAWPTNRLIAAPQYPQNRGTMESGLPPGRQTPPPPAWRPSGRARPKAQSIALPRRSSGPGRSLCPDEPSRRRRG
jgi:hypothetical protein